MFKTLASCFGALIVAIIVGSLVWTTVKRESARPVMRAEGTVANGRGSKEPVEAFQSTEMLADYLISAANQDAAEVARIRASAGATTLAAGTRVKVQGFSGAGQAKVVVLSGPHKDHILYVSYATIQEPGT